jgi:hypothetical protein
MATTPTNTTVTLQRRNSDELDSYNNPLGDYETIATYKAWVERTRYNEPQLDGETDATDFLMIIPGAVTLTDGDRIIYEGEAYEIAADAYKQRPPGGVIHHTEARMRPAIVSTLRDKLIRQLIDQCIITRENPTDENANTATGVIEYGTAGLDVIYEGPCRVRSRDAYQRETERIDDPQTLQSYVGYLPWDVTDVEDDDILTVTVTDDPRMLNRSCRITGVNVTTDNASRVVFLEDNLDQDLALDLPT